MGCRCAADRRGLPQCLTLTTVLAIAGVAESGLRRDRHRLHADLSEGAGRSRGGGQSRALGRNRAKGGGRYGATVSTAFPSWAWLSGWEYCRGRPKCWVSACGCKGWACWAPTDREPFLPQTGAGQSATGRFSGHATVSDPTSIGLGTASRGPTNTTPTTTTRPRD